MAKVKHEYFPTRAGFDTAKGNTTAYDNSVCYIEDSMEIFTHGHFWTVSNLSQYYNSSTQKLQLKNGSTVISELDASPFIKDGMLENVELITTPEGSSAVLSVNGTNYPIVILDARQFNSTSWDENGTDYSAVIIPTLDENQAYYITNVSDNDNFVFENSGEFVLKFDNNPSIFGSRSEFGTHTWANSWIGIPINIEIIDDYYTTYYGDSVYYDNATPLTSATETTSSQSSSNYPQVPYLKFTFNTVGTEPAHTVIRVSIAELFTVYNGENVILTSNYAKAQSYTEPASNDSINAAIGKLAKGISDNATAIATKQATITGAATTITSNNLTASKALVSDANGKVAVSSTTSTELGYLSGVTSNVQTQLNAKANITDIEWVEH